MKTLINLHYLQILICKFFKVNILKFLFDNLTICTRSDIKKVLVHFFSGQDSSLTVADRASVRGALAHD